MKTQPEITKMTTKHIINYGGFVVTITGKHELKFAKVSKMTFGFWVESEKRGISFGTNSKLTLREKLDSLIKSVQEAKAYRKASDDFKALYESLSVSRKIAHPNFAYARFQTGSLGNYYNIYWRSNLSPTGVELVGSCSESEWEGSSKESNNSHNYLSPTENRI